MKTSSLSSRLSSSLSRRGLLILSLVAAFSLAACNKTETAEKFINTDLTGLPYGKEFTLTDQNGKTRTLQDFKGKAVVLFFGYTQCPDVCPTTMFEMAKVMTQLGPLADRVQVLFVTVDPERDTQALLAAYVPNFDKRFLGLYGDAAATAKVAKEFKVFYQQSAGTTPENYSMDHTAASYIFDPEGRIRLYVQYGQKPEAIVHDLKILLK